MKIKEFELRGSDTYKLGKFTVLIGPNNSGKTQLLRDLQSSLETGSKSHKVVLSQVSIEAADSSELESVATKSAHPSRSDYLRFYSLGPDLHHGHRVEIEKDFLQRVDSSQAPETLVDEWVSRVGKFFVAFLDGESRLKISSACRPKDDPDGPPQRILQMLYEEQEVEEIFSKAFYDAFGFEAKLDYSTLSEMALRVAPTFPTISGNPRADRKIFRRLQKIDNQGDGFRAFAGILLSFLLLENRVLLVDEPEAFLHPVQARKLGLWMAKLALDSPGQVVVATHNAHFLEGLLGVQAADIYRLTRKGDATRLNRMSKKAMGKLTSSPLLSNLRILDALFYPSIIVCESDKDRLFYRYVLSELELDRDIAVVHAHNKQTLHKVCGLLTELGAGPVVVVDLDVFRDPSDVKRLLLATGQSWSDWSEMVFGVCRDIDKIACEGPVSWEELKEKGIGILSARLKEKLEEVIGRLSTVGIFVVEVGEVESWIPISCSKRDWIGHAFLEIESTGLPRKLKAFVTKMVGFFGNS